AASPVLGPVLAFQGPRQSHAGRRRYLLEISAYVSAGRLRLSWTYNPQIHRPALIEGLADTSIEALRALIAHCRAHEAGTHTPSDFAKFGWDDEYFQDIAAEIHKVIGW